MTSKELLILIPEFELIKDQQLREASVSTMLRAIEEGGWSGADINKCPIKLDSHKGCPLGYVDFTRMLTSVANELYDTLGEWINSMNPCNKDYVIAGALLSGIGRLLEYGIDEDGNACRSKFGELFRYPWPGANMAMENGLPLKVVHIVVSIDSAVSPGRGKVQTTAESVVVRNAEMICSGIINRLYP